MQPSLDNIAAIATAPGQGGIGVVRVSGKNLSGVVKELLNNSPLPRHATYSAFLDSEGNLIDRGIVIFFPGPNSYTGEDVLELQAHGGMAVLNLLLRRCLNVGCRLANPGEFTLRAFLNNKLDLVQAESVADLINATSEQAVRSANRSLEGAFSNGVNSLVRLLIELRMFVESSLDFPEEDLDLSDITKINENLSFIQAELKHIFNSAKQGSILREGAHVVLVGKPNVGKSSLLNCLSGEDIALVSEIAGTTRDAIRQAINIGGVPLHLIDTAGLRDSQDVVEQMGMERTKAAINKADIVLLLKDTQNEEQQETNIIFNLIPESTPKLYVINKIDLSNQEARIETHQDQTHIYISAKYGDGVELLRNKLLQMIGWHGETGIFMARERHVQALSQALIRVNNAGKSLYRLELFAEELRMAQNELNKITGNFSSDDLLGEIFSRFCIGK